MSTPRLIHDHPPRIARVRATECIGCTKCLDACPTDALVGAAKQLHTVFEEACTGCGQCLPPCPVNCIDLLPTTPPPPEQIAHWEARHARQQARLPQTLDIQSIDDRKAAIQAALKRTVCKRTA